MSFDIGTGAAFVAQEAAQIQATAAQQATLAQRFEQGLDQASQTASMAAHGIEASKTQTIDVAYRDKAITISTEVQVGLPEANINTGEQLSSYLESFNGRANQFKSDFSGMNSDTKISDFGAGAPGSETGAPAMKPLSGSDVGIAVQMMERAFQFAIETTLVSKASSETTKIFNNLMKGQ